MSSSSSVETEAKGAGGHARVSQPQDGETRQTSQRTEIGDARGSDVDGVQISVTLESVERPYVLPWDLDDGQVRALAQHRQVQQRATGRPVGVGVVQPQRAKFG